MQTGTFNEEKLIENQKAKITKKKNLIKSNEANPSLNISKTKNKTEKGT